MAIDVYGTRMRMAQGDTGSVKFAVETGEITDADKGVFTLARRDGTAILRKILPPDLKENAFPMALVYEDTVKLKPDSYEWSLRVVRDGTFDAGGRLTGAQSAHTPVLRGTLDVMKVAGGAR